MVTCGLRFMYLTSHNSYYSYFPYIMVPYRITFLERSNRRSNGMCRDSPDRSRLMWLKDDVVDQPHRQLVASLSKLLFRIGDF